DGRGQPAARGGDLGGRGAAGAHGQLGPPVAGVDRVRVRIDQAGRDQPAPQVLHLVDVDDVLDHAGDAGRQFGGGPDPGDALAVGQDGGVAPYLGAGPEPADV